MKLTVNVEVARQVVGEKLAPREWHVFLRTLGRETQDHMAEEWGITQGAVGAAKRHVLDKLGLTDEPELWIFAIQSGILKAD